MKPRLLILTAGFGEGHNAAARALAAAADAAHGPGTARLVDVFALAAPRLNGLLRHGYLGLINRAPGLWRAVYAWLDRSRHSTRPLRLLRRESRVLARLIEQERPTALCSTYPVYAYLLERLCRRERGSAPHFNVVTDSISINSLWWRADCAGWFLPNADSAAVMARAGVDPTRLHVCGFPVTSFFAEHAGRVTPPDLANGWLPRVLYVINSARPAAAETARRLLRETPWEITCTVGRNHRLRAELTRLAAGRSAPAHLLGWTNEIPRLFMTHNVVVSKAGGATTQEALAARCPMIVNQIVPGQEEGNYELLRRHGIGALAETPDAVITELHRAFAQRGRVWHEWRRALDPLVRPDAARDIIAAVVAQTSSTAEPIPLPLQAGAAAPSPRFLSA